jgi:hypothetical protein
VNDFERQAQYRDIALSAEGARKSLVEINQLLEKMRYESALFYRRALVRFSFSFAVVLGCLVFILYWTIG